LKSFLFIQNPHDIFCLSEVGIAIIISSSAIIRPVFDRIFHGIQSITKTASGGAQGLPVPSEPMAVHACFSRSESACIGFNNSSHLEPQQINVVVAAV
jgi:hypothetical protein